MDERLRQLRTRDKEAGLLIETGYGDEQYEERLYEVLYGKVQGMLGHLKKHDPQIDMNGFRNVWIVKPNCTYAIM